jgi:ATP-dependent RNA helicase DDX46/PRP5
VRKVNKIDGRKTDGKSGTAVNTNSSGVVIVTGVAKKKVDKKKGELIEQNQDGLEVGYVVTCCMGFLEIKHPTV